MPEQLFVAWTRFQRRAESMQSFFGYEAHYVPPPFARTWLKPFGYAVQAWRTLRLIRRTRPRVLWLQLPPTFLPHLVLLARPLAGGRDMRIVADCHNRTFRPPWSRMPGLARLLNRMDATIVHNDEVAGTAAALGVAADRLMVLEDRAPAFAPAPARPGPADAQAAPAVLVPCSFNPDEPIAALLDAAAAAPELRFLVTGNLDRARARGFVGRAPANVTFTGFLPTADYERLLAEATVVLGLTTIEGIQLSVAGEALSAGKPMVLSDTAILRALFGAAAVMTANEPAAIAAACRAAAADAGTLAARAVRLREARDARWLERAGELAERLALQSERSAGAGLGYPPR